jgi:hypothetical protein
MIHLVAAQVLNSGPWEWASEHLHLIGWPTLCYFGWKVSTFFSAAKTQVTKTVTQIDQLATNHFPHMEQSLAKQDIYLGNMDKNLQRMADKL